LPRGDIRERAGPIQEYVEALADAEVVAGSGYRYSSISAHASCDEMSTSAPSLRRKVVAHDERSEMAGQMVHVEIPAGDTVKAREFWSGLFGWQFEEYAGSPTEYYMTRFSETQGGAIGAADGDTRGARLYFDVDDINEANARVRELGGEAADAMPVPGMGWFSFIKDTEGNEFGLWQSDENAPGG